MKKQLIALAVVGALFSSTAWAAAKFTAQQTFDAMKYACSVYSLPDQPSLNHCYQQAAIATQNLYPNMKVQYTFDEIDQTWVLTQGGEMTATLPVNKLYNNLDRFDYLGNANPDYTRCHFLGQMNTMLSGLIEKQFKTCPDIMPTP